MRRTSTVRVALAIALLGMLAPAALAHPSSSEIREELDETRSQLEATRDDLHTVTADMRRAQEDLAEVNLSLARAQSRLAEIEEELAVAVAAHQEATKRVEDANNRLVAATNRIRRVEAQLKEREGYFDARVAATYKYGTVTYAQALVGSSSFADFLQSLYYVRSALDYDQTVITEVTNLTRDLAERRAEVALLRDEALDEERAAKIALDEMNLLAAAQREATEAIATERGRQRTLLAQLDRERATYEAMVAELESDSQQLEADLRRAQEEERRSGEGWDAGAPGVGELVWPTDGRVTSGYGYRTHPIFGGQRMHSGIDIPGPVGQAIVAAADGYVISAGWRGGYGLAVVIDHGGGLATLYAHMSAIDVAAGQIVSSGQRIGGIGSTGQSTGPHLHFEVRVNGSPRDPMDWYR